MKTIQLSAEFALPLDVVTHRNALLAMSGAGKSNLGVVLAEEMHRFHIPWIAIDPKGDWYGVRSSQDGKGPGLDVPVLGGEHGDLPLSPRSGARMAELVAAGKLAGVFDVSDFETQADVSRWLTDFARTLLKKQRTPIHIFFEECADYLPQGGRGGQLDPLASACVGACKKLATRGRFRGIGYTLISQRAADVNKSALYQCETLIAMRVMGKRDKEAIRGWVEQHQGSDELLKSLSTLQDGEAWVWSPQRLKLMERVRVRRRSTFDSGRTPGVGEALVVPKLAPIDIETLRAELAAAEPNDSPSTPSGQGPKKGSDGTEVPALRTRITELERELRERPTVQIVGQRTVNALDDAAEKMRLLGADLVAAARGIREALKERGSVVPYRTHDAPVPKLGNASLATIPAPPAGPSVVERDPKPAKRSAPPAAPGTITPKEGWTMEEEVLFQKIKARLIEEAPEIVKAYAERPELEVTIERKVVTVDGESLRGRLARLIADGFFGEPVRCGPITKELGRIGPSAHPTNVGRECDKLVAMGILTDEGKDNGYRIAPGAKVTKNELASG
jgi:hypothetical protein